VVITTIECQLEKVQHGSPAGPNEGIKIGMGMLNGSGVEYALGTALLRPICSCLLILYDELG
jgi:hypothetical protein